MQNLLELIGEAAPYVRAYDVVADNGVVHARFKPEQERYAETTLMSCSEALRSMGIHGTLVCAAANPRKVKHYYLATRAEVRVLPVQASHADVFHCEGRLVRMDSSQRFPVYTAAMTGFTSGGERYVDAEADYVAFDEQQFVSVKGADDTPMAAWTSGRPSPYERPVSPMRMEWVRPGEALRATLGELRHEDFAGHFPLRALCPVSILGGHACTLPCHFPGFEAYQITRCLLTCRSASRPGEPVDLTCVAEGAGRFVVTALDARGKVLSTFYIDARPG
ncbi:hypothetical protein ACN469_35260 [Corallococcus terminator]